MAKMGVYWAFEGLVDRPGPAFVATPFASYPASQLAIQAILAALHERERTNLGQRVETTLAQAFTVHDTAEWFARVLAQKYGGGHVQVPRVVDGVPTGGLSFRLLVALTKDGKWLQFSQTSDRLFRAMMILFGLDWMFADPKWSTAPDFDDASQRDEFWGMLLDIVRGRTAAEWMAAFATDENVWGERFEAGSQLLHHPQMVWNGMVGELDDPALGRVRQLAPLVRLGGASPNLKPAPALGQYDAAVRAEAAGPEGHGPTAARPRGLPGPAAPPLAGVTIVELATYYAAPYGATLLAELGARVIKLEQPDGDPHRNLLPFPELSGLKVLQGKESVAIDLATLRGRSLARRIIASADIVLQGFRAGVAERLGLDAETLRTVNPNIIYLAAPGYGEDGPYARYPAFAPTIGAAAGLAWRNLGGVLPEDADLAMDDIKRQSLRLTTAVRTIGNADALSAVSAATAMLLGLVARDRGAGTQPMLTTMLSSTGHALSETMIEYAQQPQSLSPDAGAHGFSALYRLYEAMDDWVFLASPTEKDWTRLTGVLPNGAGLRSDRRFADAAGRARNDAELAVQLAAVFCTAPAASWERQLLAVDVACVVASRRDVQSNYMDEGGLGDLCGFITSADHPILGETPRLKPLVRFSRSPTVAGGAGLLGQDTEEVLLGLGYAPTEIATLSREGIIALG
jgi:crotonobetainyl-CoA:carnitine CoA-transferase CaiB-like acyl-CoA transferase